MSSPKPERLIGVGLYSFNEAAKVLSQQISRIVSTQKLHRWGKGYHYPYLDQIRESAPLVDTDNVKLGVYELLSFEELVELLVICAFRKEGVSNSVIRVAREKAKQIFRSSHPFALQRFDTDGEGVFATIKREDAPEIPEDRLTVELTKSQVAFDKIVRQFFRNLTYVNSIATELWPLGHDRNVVISPERSFGKPIDAKSGVPTSVLWAMVEGGSSKADVASWYEVEVASVEDAIDYEKALRRAA